LHATVCDDIVTGLVEDDHGYRIRQPAEAGSALPGWNPVGATIPVPRPGVDPHTVTLTVYSPEPTAAGTGFTGR